MEIEDPDQPALAVDPTGLLPNIIRYCLSEGDASLLALNAQLMNTRFRAYQIVRLIELASTELHITLSARAIAHAFEARHSAVKRTQLRGYDDPPARGRHHELSADAEQQLLAWITAKAANKVAVNRTELLQECNERFGKSITRGWVDSFLTRHAGQFFESKSATEEDPKFEVPRVFLQAELDGF
jgi:transposase